MSLFCKTLALKSPPFLLTISRLLSSSTAFDPPTSSSYDEQVAAAGRSRDFEALHRLLNQRYKDGCFNTKKTFKFITDTIEHDETLIPDLIQTLSRLDSGFARKNAFDSLVSHLCKTNRVDDSVRVIAAMVRGEYGVNATTFHPLLNALTRKRRIDEAWRIIAMMKESGTNVDVTAYNYVLTAHCVEGEAELAAEVVERIEAEGLRADARTYDAAAMGCCRVGRVEGAVAVVRRMAEEGVPALYSTHAHVIKGLVGLAGWREAVDYVRVVGGRDVLLDRENFGFLGSVLVRRRRVVEAKMVFDEMGERGLDVGEKLRREYVALLEASKSRFE
ncbi:hypothetical protein Scep_005721 [Stephania cephalantha]|uniref:Pentatricopeptide repeat-containing protein-mitochondrial domain-containing protein n=1 Tax=Stephania cephalantha TaxID=152367 RepID=A0AAP0KUW6_9MAGN